MLWQLNRLGVVDGFCVAGVLLFCVSIPHTRVDGRLVWWWQLLGQRGAGPLAVFSIYALLASLCLPFVAVLLRGWVRAWVFVLSAAIGLGLLIVVTAAGPMPSAALAVGIVPVALMAMLVGLSLIRPAAPRAQAGRVLQAVLGGGCCAVGLAAFIIALASLLAVRQSDALPGWAMFATIVASLGWVAGLCSGAMGLAAIRTSWTQLANRIGITAAVVASALLAIAAAVVGYSLTELLPVEGAKFYLVQMLRLVVAAYTLSTLLTIGLSEMLVSSWSVQGQNESFPVEAH